MIEQCIGLLPDEWLERDVVNETEQHRCDGDVAWTVATLVAKNDTWRDIIEISD